MYKQIFIFFGKRAKFLPNLLELVRGKSPEKRSPKNGPRRKVSQKNVSKIVLRQKNAKKFERLFYFFID